MEELKKTIDSDIKYPTRLLVYTDCAGGDQKNKYFLNHLSMFRSNNPWSRAFRRKYQLPIIYFQKPADHNKWSSTQRAGCGKGLT